jgi:hypothetical protein
MTPEAYRPTDAELAAFIDGRLSGSERQRVAEAIEADPGSYEVVVEALRFLEAEAEAELRPSREKPRGRPFSRPQHWWPVAAVLVLAFGGWWLWSRTAAVPQLPIQQLAALLENDPAGALGPTWSEQSWSVMRGSNASATERAVAFRSGVLTVDLELALRHGHQPTAARLVDDLETHARERDQTAGALFAYAEIARQLREGEAPADARSILIQADHLESRSTVATHYVLGKWIETARLAAASGNAETLGQAWFRRAGRHLVADEALERDPRERLKRILDLLDSPPSDAERIVGELRGVAAAF